MEHIVSTDENVIAYSNLDEVIALSSMNIVWIGFAILLIITIISLKLKKPHEGTKRLLFSSIVATILFVTIYLAGATIYLNTISSSKGPVHWHADFEIYACGQELELVDPMGLSNKVGTATLHEHNDKRIHLEGVVVEPADASLGKFFKVVGGELSNDFISIPTSNGLISFESGGSCPDGQIGELQVFVYKTIQGMYMQQRLTSPAEYIISPESGVPDGDCIIVEFGEPMPTTDKLCRSYKVAEQIGKIKKAGY